jgi:DNA-binding response OmpR family regulator
MVEPNPLIHQGAILLVEDDPTFAGYLSKRLAQAGYSVDWAPDGLRALAQMRRTPPDLLLMDLAVPALDGLSLLRRMREDAELAPALANLPVIVLTGRFSASDVEQATALGVADYIAKPFDETAFLASIAVHIRKT